MSRPPEQHQLTQSLVWISPISRCSLSKLPIWAARTCLLWKRGHTLHHWWPVSATCTIWGYSSFLPHWSSFVKLERKYFHPVSLHLHVCFRRRTCNIIAMLAGIDVLLFEPFHSQLEQLPLPLAPRCEQPRNDKQLRECHRLLPHPEAFSSQ